MNRGQVVDASWVRAGARGRSVRYVPALPDLHLLHRVAMGSAPSPVLMQIMKRAEVLPEEAPEPVRRQPIADKIRATMLELGEPASPEEIAARADLETRQVRAYLWRTPGEVVVSGIYGTKRYSLSALGIRYAQEAADNAA